MKGYDLQMFMHIYPVIYKGYNLYRLSSDKQIINTTQIVSITIKSESPTMDTSEHKEKLEKIFDTKFTNLAVFYIEFSNHKDQYVIGPKSKFENII